MMRRILLCMSVFLFSTRLFAADGSSGCGAGWYILKDNSLVSSTLRATTNGLFFNATFGMTSGTSNCAKHSIVQNDKRSLHFMESNFVALKTDMARGQGEYLGAFADTLGCSWEAMGALSDTVQGQYDEIFQSGDAQTAVFNIRRQIQANPSLSSYCQGA